ncbi:hypothetical protein BKA69DRAFT_1040529 [Paraphysoderma sedebokerense]|nr:hypothetical protein BKA69DRAFT_1040521 [Paraphysoderma sedebokerense]KAI9138952.1 hypothetical protein BKA69DRAFT_1040529 [Paraphysoderma sedebokerense]
MASSNQNASSQQHYNHNLDSEYAASASALLSALPTSQHPMNNSSSGYPQNITYDPNYQQSDNVISLVDYSEDSGDSLDIPNQDIPATTVLENGPNVTNESRPPRTPESALNSQRQSPHPPRQSYIRSSTMGSPLQPNPSVNGYSSTTQGQAIATPQSQFASQQFYSPYPQHPSEASNSAVSFSSLENPQLNSQYSAQQAPPSFSDGQPRPMSEMYANRPTAAAAPVMPSFRNSIASPNSAQQTQSQQKPAPTYLNYDNFSNEPAPAPPPKHSHNMSSSSAFPYNRTSPAYVHPQHQHSSSSVSLPYGQPNTHSQMTLTESTNKPLPVIEPTRPPTTAGLAVFFVFFFKAPNVQFDRAVPPSDAQPFTIQSDGTWTINWGLRFNATNQNFFTINLNNLAVNGFPTAERTPPALATGSLPNLSLASNQPNQFTLPFQITYNPSTALTDPRSQFLVELVRSCTGSDNGRIKMFVNIEVGWVVISWTGYKFKFDRDLDFACPVDLRNLRDRLGQR